MTQEVFVNLIKKEFDWLIQKGFEIGHVERNIKFEKTFQDKAYAIRFSWAEYDVIKVDRVSCLKRFNKVEKIIGEILQREMDYTIHKKCIKEIPKIFNSEANGIVLTNAIYISNEHQVKQFSEFVKEFFENEAAAFFDQFKTLEDIIEEMNNLPSDQKASMIGNTGNSTFLRIATIKYLVNPDDGLKFYNETLKKLEPVKNERSFAAILNDLHKLIEYFTSQAE